MPARYSKTEPIVTELPYLSMIEVNGTDARRFLHDQLSADIRTLNAGEATFAGLCRMDGRTLALLLVWSRDGGFGAICAESLADPVVAHLTKFVLRADVQIRGRGDLRVFGGVDSSESGLTLQPLPNLRYTVQTGGGARSDREAESWKAAEIAQGVVWLAPETSGELLPQMLGLEHIGALNFRKGCFPGQEVIARVRYLGKLKRRPLLVRASEPMQPGPMDRVTLLAGDAEFEAVIVDSARPADGETIMLAVVQSDEDIQPARMRWGERVLTVQCVGLMEQD